MGYVNGIGRGHCTLVESHSLLHGAHLAPPAPLAAKPVSPQSDGRCCLKWSRVALLPARKSLVWSFKFAIWSNLPAPECGQPLGMPWLTFPTIVDCSWVRNWWIIVNMNVLTSPRFCVIRLDASHAVKWKVKTLNFAGLLNHQQQVLEYGHPERI